MTPAFQHAPVMLTEVVDLFASVPPGTVVDATVGGGGHAAALLDAHDHLNLIGLDRDQAAVDAASETLARFGPRARVFKARFDEMRETLAEVRVDAASGVLFDLGVSSAQFDVAERGFSYRTDAPLDMRMDRSQRLTAAEVVNTYSAEDLGRILRRFGDERFARRIAQEIVEARPLHTTEELVDVIRAAIPAPARRRGGHPAKRTFQALRIEVNRELDVLRPALQQAIDMLVPGGRCVVLAYHSGEDRIVKEVFRTASTGGCVCPPGLPCACGAVPTVRELRRSVRKPSAAEVESNPRSESARLRAVEKLEGAV